MGIFVSDWSIAAGQETVAFWPGGNAFSKLMMSVLEDTSTRMGIVGLTSTFFLHSIGKGLPVLSDGDDHFIDRQLSRIG